MPASSPAPIVLVAAAAGDTTANVDRIIGILQAQTTICEYDGCIGKDVEYISIHDDHHDDSFHPAQHVLSVEAVAYLARGQISSSLRTTSPLQVCLLVAGMQADHETNQNVHAMACYSSHLQQQVQRASRDFSTNPPPAASTTMTVKNNVAETNDIQQQQQDMQSSLVVKPRLYWLDSYGALQKLQYGAHGLGANFLLSILDDGFRPNMTRDEALFLMQECFRQLKMRFVINSPQSPCIKCVDAYGCHVLQR